MVKFANANFSAIRCKRGQINLDSKWALTLSYRSQSKMKKRTDTKGNMLGNLDLTLQLESKVLVNFQVKISYVLTSAKPNLGAH